MTNSTSIMDILKAETDQRHRHAESRDLQRSMASGQVSKDDYVRWLGQMLLIHQALEEQIDASAAAHPAFASVCRPDQKHAPQLRDDLRHWDIPLESISPLDATNEAVGTLKQFAADQPLALFGCLYVLEGSMNGNRFLAMALARAFNTPPGPGLSYLSPYGSEQKERWQEFRENMNAIEFGPDERDALVHGAKFMFDAIADLSEALAQPAPAPPD